MSEVAEPITAMRGVGASPGIALGPVITIDVDPKGAIKQLNAPGDNVIKQLTTEEAEAALAKLRPA